LNYQIKYQPKSTVTEFNVPLSKSFWNRLLVIQKLAGIELEPVPESAPRDVRLLAGLLSEPNEEKNVSDAGTAMRFGTAYLAQKTGSHVLSGTDRMHKRPIGILVKALNELGADITYDREEGYPPLSIHGKRLKGGTVRIQSDISSQFLSALILIAPYTEEGIQLQLEGTVVSEPYLEMTLKLVEKFGAVVKRSGSEIKIDAGSFQKITVAIERDWSAAAYAYQSVALGLTDELFIPGLSPEDTQGDRRIVELFRSLGVESTFEKNGLKIKRTEVSENRDDFDFSDIPDLVQSFVFTCAGLGKSVQIKGLHNLHLKETDRINAMQFNLQQLGAQLLVNGSEAHLEVNQLSERAQFKGFDDHRMIMSLAPLAFMIKEVQIDQVDEVSKSFPNYWDEIAKLGITKSV
jgi:3-phosphoshikimate 1-carboxyvinyltransferase